MNDTDHHPSVPTVSLPRMSKSKFVSGLQCLKRLYLEVHRPHLATPPDASLQAILHMGSEVGELARCRYSGGVLVTAGSRQREAALEQTAQLLQDPAVPAIFEGAFFHEGVLVRADILERVPGSVGEPSGWRLIEVKSSTKLKDVHLNDLAIQSHVLLGAGVSLITTCLMHINTGYLYEEGAIDLMQLFTVQDMTEAVAVRRAKVPEQLDVMRTMLLQGDPPLIEPGPHCQSPYECQFWDRCTAEKPARWIFHLPGSKRSIHQLMEQGVTLIDDIPEGTTLSLAQRRVKDNAEWISAKLGRLLESVQYPVHHVDFETVMLAVPRFPRTRPYQAIPIQWSNHIEHESGALTHDEFLHEAASEPRRRWAEALLASLGTHGSICVYSAYERAVLEQLADAFPEFRAAFKPIIARLWDLFPIIRDHYYHPAFHGSFSIKSVLPAVVPSLGYEDLTIREGGQAASEYHRMVFVESDWIEQASIKEALLQYCARDTLAMVELRRILKKKAEMLSEVT